MNSYFSPLNKIILNLIIILILNPSFSPDLDFDLVLKEILFHI